jgi:hypothetical protein
MACNRCGRCGCGNSGKSEPKATVHVSQLSNMTGPVIGNKGQRPEPYPVGTWRYAPSKDPYASNLRYGMATGAINAVQLSLMGLDPMAFVPMEPQFVQTERGMMVVGTNTQSPPVPKWPYDPRSHVMLALAYGLKHGIISFDQARALGLEPFYIRPFIH